MIYVEIHILDQNTFKPVAHYSKTFVSSDEYIKFYRLAKMDTSSVINVLFYDPSEKYGQKDVNDVKLYSLSRELPV